MKLLLLLAAIFFACTNINAQTFIELNNQFLELFKKKAYTESIPVGIKALAQAKIEYGETHENFAIASKIVIDGAINSRICAEENGFESACFISSDKSRAATTLYNEDDG